MSHGIVKIPLIPGRKEGSDRSEMVTQLLFGELYTVLEEKEKWVFIENEADGYQCWIDRKQHNPIHADAYQNVREAQHQLSTEILGETESGMRIPFGSKVNYSASPSISEISNFKGDTARRQYADIETYARLFLDAPYLWGGKSILGIDCSGFCQVVYSACGIEIPRDAYQQAEQGVTIEFLQEAKTGDLAYFDNKEGRITHVGILLDRNEIIHASGKVRIDRIDHEGIYNEELKKYTHKLRIIKRINP